MTVKKLQSARQIRGFIAFLLVIGAISAMLTPVRAEASEAASALSELLNQACGADMQGWLDGALSQDAENANWYVFGLRLLDGELSTDTYSEALKSYLASDGASYIGASTKQKHALTLLACGAQPSEFTAILDLTSGKQGIMSLVFALHLVNNGVVTSANNAQTVIPLILARQLEDGGWALSGKRSDTDVTAMAIQALAPYYDLYSEVKNAIDAAISTLSALQNASGGFSSYGVENAESSAQVLIALSALGISPTEDSRFIKNGNTPLTALLSFRTSDGGFSHTAGGARNEAATSQAFLALATLDAAGTKCNPFLFGDAPTDAPPLVYPEGAGGENGSGASDSTNGTGGSQENGGTPSPENRQAPYKLPVCISIGALAAVICLYLFLRGKRGLKYQGLCLVLAAALIAAVLTLNFSSPDGYYGEKTEKPDAIGSVTVEIRCDTVMGKENAPDTATLLPVTEVALCENETVYDILLQITRERGLKLESSGAAATGSVYVRGIGSLYEYGYGELSGWIYRVNGASASVSCAEYKLSDGDRIVWHYTLELGADIGEQ